MAKSIECVRKLWFCCGHRIVDHEHKCANVHGHNFTAYIYARSGQLDTLGRVIDFSVIKKNIGSWIDEFWDHSFIIYNKDPILMPLKDKLIVNKAPYIVDFNPTAENLALYLLEKICPQLMEGTGVTIRKVELCETDINRVIVSLD